MFLNKKWATLITLIVVMATVLSACAPTTPLVVQKEVVKEVPVEKAVVVEKPVVVEKEVVKEVPVEKAVVVEKPVVVEKEVVKEVPVEKEVVKEVVVTATPAPPEVREFVGAWPYQVPPVGHLNSYVTNNLNLGIYQDLMEMPLAMYYWASGEWMPLLATEWKLVPPDLFTVTLRKGVKWSDGSGFTAQDVVTTFEVGRIMKWVVWKYLDRVEAADDYTVNFYMAEPSTVVPRYVLRERMRADSVYGDFARRAKGLEAESDAMSDLRKEFQEFRPEKPVVTGPFKIDMGSITEARLTLIKNPTAWNADQVGFDRVVLYNGETPTVTPIVLTKAVDYATHGFPPATEMQFKDLGIRILRPPIYSGPALYVKHDIYPLNVKEVRQAMAYAVDREENAIISLGESAIAQKYMTGVSDNLIPLWMSESDLAKLNQYPHDPDKAEEILLGLGFTRDSDGVWVDDKGTRMEYELTVPAEYADWSAAAENLAEQLTAFGIKVTVRGVTFTQHPIEVNQGKFEMAIRGWGAGHPHPHFSFSQDLFTHNYVAAVEGKGMNYPLVQETEALGEIDLEEAVVKSAEGLDEEAQKALVTRMAIAFNELLPIVPIWERYGNNPALEDVRVTGWPPEGDPIYKNSPYADSFVIMMILDGTLRPAR